MFGCCGVKANVKYSIESWSGNFASMSNLNLRDSERVCPEFLSEIIHAMCASRIWAVNFKFVLSVRVMVGLVVLSLEDFGLGLTLPRVPCGVKVPA